jgi:hypothetical protein
MVHHGQTRRNFYQFGKIAMASLATSADGGANAKQTSPEFQGAQLIQLCFIDQDTRVLQLVLPHNSPRSLVRMRVVQPNLQMIQYLGI